jgi:outer membrane protein
MSRFVLPLVAILLVFSAIAQDTANKWTLRKCVDYAVRNNISIRQAGTQTQLSQIDVHQNEMTKLPTLGASLSGGYNFGLSNNPATGTLESNNFFAAQAGVQTNYTIFNWNVRKNSIEASKLALKAAEAGIEKAQNDISLSVANSFLQAMLNNETVRIAEIQMNQSLAQLTNTNVLVRAGSVPELNSLQLQAQVANDSATLIQARSNYRQALIQLKALLNLPQDTTFEIVIPPVELIPVQSLADLNPGYVYNMAITNQPLQRANEFRLQQSKKQVFIARGSMYPSIGAQGSLSTAFTAYKYPITAPDFSVKPDTNKLVYINSPSNPLIITRTKQVGTFRIPLGEQLKNNFGQFFGIGINFNIFNQHQARSQWERAKIIVRQNELQQQQDNLNLQSDIYNAYELAVTALQRYNASLRQVETTEKAMDFANKRYTLGLLNVLDLITTQNNLLRARVEMVRNRYDYVFKMKVLEFYKGLGIQL